MNYIIFGDLFTFPEGGAATNRVHAYAKGLSENDLKVHVICFGNNTNNVADGMINGYFFYHPFGQRKRNKYFIFRRWLKIIKYFKTFRVLQTINENDKIIAINCYSDSFLTQFFIFILAKYFRTKLILEHSEHPLKNFQDSYMRKILGNIKIYSETKICDGIFCISNYLIHFFLKKGVNEKKLFLVPSTVDAERFKTSSCSPLEFQYILYCGSLTLMKDGVDILIKSFASISDTHPEINLVLIGKSYSFDTDLFFRDLVLSLKIEERVFFIGEMSRNEVPAYLNNAKILALARPSSMIASAGFPSKLTEYLATGIPVVVTEVGDIPIYLSDNENAFLSKPDSVEAFAGKLDYVLQNYKFAQDVGKKGQELTSSVFSYNFQASRMIEFIKSLLI